MIEAYLKALHDTKLIYEQRVEANLYSNCDLDYAVIHIEDLERRIKETELEIASDN